MAATMCINGKNFGSSQSSSFVHLWFTPDNPHSCATDTSTINWGEPGNEASFTGWSDTAITFQVPTPSGPNRRLGSTLGDNLWMIPAGDTACLTVTTGGGTTGTASFTAQSPATQSYSSSGYTVGFDGPGVYGFRGGNHGPGSSAALVCSYGGGQALLDQQGFSYPVWDLVDAGCCASPWWWCGTATANCAVSSTCAGTGAAWSSRPTATRRGCAAPTTRGPTASTARCGPRRSAAPRSRPSTATWACRTAGFLDYYFGADADEAWIEQMMAFDTEVGDQDAVLVAAARAGVAGSWIDRGRILPAERLLADFQRYVYAACADEVPAGVASV
jgi:hypothetical protein